MITKSRNQKAPDAPSHPWMIYVLIAIASFATGIMLTMALHSPAPPQTSAMPHSSAPASATSSALPLNGDPVMVGNAYYDQQNWTAAIKQYERAISLGNDTPDVRTDLGNAYRFAGNPHKALEQYQIAQRQDPNHEQSLFNQGALYAQSLGDPVTGAAKWRDFINRFPSSPRATDARRLLMEFDTEFGTPPKTASSPVR